MGKNRKHLLLIITFILFAFITMACKQDKSKQSSTEEEDQPTEAAERDTFDDPTDKSTIKPTDLPTCIPTLMPTLTPTPTPAPSPSPTPTPIPFTGPLEGTMTKENYPRVDGSTATIPLSEAVYCLATGATPEEAANEILHTKTTNAYYRLADNGADLLIVYAASEDVLKQIEAAGYKLNIKPIGKDALVFMANASNPVQSLTHEQLVDIYSGKLTDWSQVGGEKEELLAFQRPVDSGSQNMMLKLVMKDTPMMSGPNVMTFDSMEGILEAMADYSNEGNTLGYSVFYYAKNMYQMPELKFMKVNGVEPSLQTIYDNTYPYINEFYAVIREDEPEGTNARKIFDWLTAEDGQALVKELGYVPVSMAEAERQAEVQKLKEQPLPKNQYYITASYTIYDYEYGSSRGTVTIYKDDWEVVRVFHNAVVDQVGLISKDEDIIIGRSIFQNGGEYEFHYGLYSLSKQTFHLPWIYDSLSLLDSEKGLYIANSGEDRYSIIDRNGKELRSGFKGEPSFRGFQEGDGYHLYAYSEYEPDLETHYILNKNLKIIRQYTENEFNRSSAFNEAGDLILDEEIFLEKFKKKAEMGEYLYICDHLKDNPILSLEFGDLRMILDLKLNVIALKEVKDDDKSGFYDLYHDIYKDVTYDRNTDTYSRIFYDQTGNMIKDKNGNTYGNIVENNFEQSIGESEYEQILYQEEDDKLRIYHYNDGWCRELNIGNWRNVVIDYIVDDLVIINSEGENRGTRIYKNDKLIAELDDNYYFYPYLSELNHTDQILLRGEMPGEYYSYLLFDSRGNITYQSAYPERLISVDPDYIQLERGNYAGVIDFEGNYIIKTIKNDLISD
jgi:ABC-type phosphate transport system substrate-binding protein